MKYNASTLLTSRLTLFWSLFHWESMSLVSVKLHINSTWSFSTLLPLKAGDCEVAPPNSLPLSIYYSSFGPGCFSLRQSPTKSGIGNRPYLIAKSAMSHLVILGSLVVNVWHQFILSEINVASASAYAVDVDIGCTSNSSAIPLLVQTSKWTSRNLKEISWISIRTILTGPSGPTRPVAS